MREHFAYPEVTGELAREAFGADLSDVGTFSDVTVTSETLKGCQDAFNLSADAVRSKVGASSVETDDVQAPAELDETHPIRASLADTFGSDFLACTWKLGDSPDAFLSYVQKAHPGFDGVAYFDQFGNLIFLAENDPDISAQSAFMRVTRKVAEARNTDPIEGYEVDAYLQNPGKGYFVYMTCPKPSARTIMELGAIGSTLESAAEHPIIYINGAENEKEIDALIARLPPLYKSVIGIEFEQITPAASEWHCELRPTAVPRRTVGTHRTPKGGRARKSHQAAHASCDVYRLVACGACVSPPRGFPCAPKASSHRFTSPWDLRWLVATVWWLPQDVPGRTTYRLPPKPRPRR